MKQHGEQLGKDLYRMFLGYTKEQLQAGEAARLVDFLDSDSLDCRVLAFANLQEITNKTFSYRPEAPTASRAAAASMAGRIKDRRDRTEGGSRSEIAPSVRCQD